MTARIKDPANLLLHSMTGIRFLGTAAHGAGVPRSTMELTPPSSQPDQRLQPLRLQGVINAE